MMAMPVLVVGKRYLVVVLCLSICMSVLAGYAYGAPVGRFVWEQFHIASVAGVFGRNDAVLNRDIGVYHFTSTRYEPAVAERYLRRAVTLDAAVPFAHFELGRIAFIKGDLATAIIEADKELSVNPTFPNSYYLRGLTYAYAGALAAAAADFRTFLTLKPQSWAGHNDLAWIYFRQGEYEAVVMTAREGLAAHPGNPWLENTLGTALLNLGAYEEAGAHLLAAQKGFDVMSSSDWGGAYPGNDPRIYEEGLVASRAAVEENLALVAQKLKKI